MSLLGEFARVPETLCHKFYKPGSLSRTWAYTPRQYYEVCASCMRELWNSALTRDEKLAIATPLTQSLANVNARLRQEAAIAGLT